MDTDVRQAPSAAPSERNRRSSSTEAYTGGVGGGGGGGGATRGWAPPEGGYARRDSFTGVPTRSRPMSQSQSPPKSVASPRTFKYAPPPPKDYSRSADVGGYSGSAAPELTPSPEPAQTQSQWGKPNRGGSDWRDQREDEWKPESHVVTQEAARDDSLTPLERARAIFSQGDGAASSSPRERRKSTNPFDRSSQSPAKSPQKYAYQQQQQQQHAASASQYQQQQRQQQSSSPAPVNEFTSVMQRIKGIRNEKEKKERVSPIRRRNSFTSEEMPPPMPRPGITPGISPTRPARTSAPTSQMVQAPSSGPDKCIVCFKTVYMMEKVLADGHCFHKWCMKCTTCSSTLSAGNYAINNGVLYCKPHFKQRFAESGGRYNFA